MGLTSDGLFIPFQGVIRNVCYPHIHFLLRFVLILSYRNSSVSMVTNLRAGRLGFDSLQGQGISLLATGVSRLTLGSIQSPMQWVPASLSMGVKRPGREGDHSISSRAEVKNAWTNTSTTQYVFMTWYLVKRRDNFAFTSVGVPTYLLPLQTVNPTRGDVCMVQGLTLAVDIQLL
jgi:hypothetical protein